MTYTQTQLEQMPDAELDALAATVVMRWVLAVETCGPEIDKEAWFEKQPDGSRRFVEWKSDWSPTTYWAEMGEVWSLLETKPRLNLNIDWDSFHKKSQVQICEDSGRFEIIVPVNRCIPTAVTIAAILAVQEMKQWSAPLEPGRGGGMMIDVSKYEEVDEYGLPTWSYCDWIDDNGSHDALTVFIYDNEPSAVQDRLDRKWRKQLANLIKMIGGDAT
jgi:hypothetical protein